MFVAILKSEGGNAPTEFGPQQELIAITWGWQEICF
jgi:hypothetical protein